MGKVVSSNAKARIDCPDGRVLRWSIIDGTTQEPLCSVDSLSEEQKELSIASIWPHQVLVEKLEQNWTPARSEQLRSEARSDQFKAKESKSERIQHYLYVRSQTEAAIAAEELKRDGFRVDVRPSADTVNWLVLVKQMSGDSQEAIQAMRHRLEQLAMRLGGEYDGWQGRVPS